MDDIDCMSRVFVGTNDVTTSIAFGESRRRLLRKRSDQRKCGPATDRQPNQKRNLYSFEKRYFDLNSI